MRGNDGKWPLSNDGLVILMEHETVKQESKSYIAIYILILIAAGMMLFNQYQIFQIDSGITGYTILSSSMSGTPLSPSSDGVAPKGVPDVYGQEIGISFDDISADDPAKADETIKKLAAYDVNIKLSGDSLQRYISIASNISCEYCCGAPSIIFPENIGKYKAGDAACGCAHSYAMRGLAKYLIQNHAEMSDSQILEELGKWKTLFFPDIMSQKADVLKQKGIEFNYINLASNNYRGIEKDSTSGGGMVGGC